MTDSDDLDDLLRSLRRAQTRTINRRRLLRGLDDVPSIGVLRVIRTIELLQRGEAAPSIGDVAVALGVEHSRASRLVSSAVSLGLVLKEGCEKDQRRSKLQLSPRGMNAAAGATKNRRAMLAEVLDSWSPEDVATLTSLVRRLRDGYDTVRDL